MTESLPLLEGRGLLIFDEGAEHELGGKLLLVREAGGVDGGEALDEDAAAGQRVVVGAGREVGELVVVALVSEIGGVLRIVAEFVLPDLVEEARESTRTGGDVLRGGSGRGNVWRWRWSGAGLGVQRCCCGCTEQKDDTELLHGNFDTSGAKATI